MVPYISFLVKFAYFCESDSGVIKLIMKYCRYRTGTYYLLSTFVWSKELGMLQQHGRYLPQPTCTNIIQKEMTSWKNFFLVPDSSDANILNPELPTQILIQNQSLPFGSGNADPKQFSNWFGGGGWMDGLTGFRQAKHWLIEESGSTSKCNIIGGTVSLILRKLPRYSSHGSFTFFSPLIGLEMDVLKIVSNLFKGQSHKFRSG